MPSGSRHGLCAPDQGGGGEFKPVQAKASQARSPAAQRQEPRELPQTSWRRASCAPRSPPLPCIGKPSTPRETPPQRQRGRAGGRGLSFPARINPAGTGAGEQPLPRLLQEVAHRIKARRGWGAEGGGHDCRVRQRVGCEPPAREVAHGCSQGPSHAEVMPNCLPDKKGRQQVGKGCDSIPASSKRGEFAQHSTGSIWVFFKPVLSDRSSSQIT